MSQRIRVGVGGWTFEPWRGLFYPQGLKQKDELAYASRHLTAIEINGTFYSSFKPESWRAWREATPEGFVFAVKGGRFCTNRKELRSAEESVGRFFRQGIVELGDRLGPVLWQLPHYKRFDADDLDAFLTLLPRCVAGRPIRHALEARHASFRTPEFIQMLRAHGVANVYARHEKHPEIADITADFVYARLQTGTDDEAEAYPAAELDDWAERLVAWAQGRAPDGLPTVAEPAPPGPREVFAFIIHEGKIRAPAGAMALIGRLESANP